MIQRYNNCDIVIATGTKRALTQVFSIGQVVQKDPTDGLTKPANATTPKANIVGVSNELFVNDYLQCNDFSVRDIVNVDSSQAGIRTAVFIADVIGGTPTQANVGDSFDISADGMSLNLASSTIGHLKIEAVLPSAGTAIKCLVTFNN